MQFRSRGKRIGTMYGRILANRHLSGVAGHRSFRCTSRKEGQPLFKDTSRKRTFCNVLLNMQV